MTNEQAKQEAIKKGYGELYKKISRQYYIDSNGYLEFTDRNIHDTYNTHPAHLGLDPNIDVDWNGTKWRPVTLRGFSDNNGWTRIEPDGSNLPTEDIDCHIIVKSSGNMRFTKFYLENFKGWKKVFTSDHVIGIGWQNVTHYKPIVKDLPPIY